MDYKFNLFLLIGFCSINLIWSLKKDVELKRYIITAPVTTNFQPVQYETVQYAIPNRKTETFIQYKPGTSYQIVDAPNSKINIGPNIQPGSITSQTTTYHYSNYDDPNVKKEAESNLLNIINLLEHPNNQNTNIRPQTVSNPKVTYTSVQVPAQFQSQVVQNTNKQQTFIIPQTIPNQKVTYTTVQVPSQFQPQVPSQFQPEIQFKTSNQITYKNSPGQTEVDDDDKIGGKTLGSLLGGGSVG